MSAPTIDSAAFILSRPKPPEWYAEQRRLFLEAIKPINAYKMHLFSIYMPTLNGANG